MSDNKEDPLEFLKTHHQNETKFALVQTSLLAIAEGTSDISKYSDWLMAGAGVSILFLLTEANSLINLLTKDGFVIIVLTLSTSMFAALFAKFKAIQCSMSVRMHKIHIGEIKKVFEDHDVRHEELKELSGDRKDEINTDIDFRTIMEDTFKPFSSLTKKSMMKEFEKGYNNRLYSYYEMVKKFNSQVHWTYLQTFLLVFSFMLGAWLIN